MFSRRAMTLESICEVLGIGLQELSSNADREREPMARLSEAQEQTLVDEPALVLAMFLTINRWSQVEVLAIFDFEAPQWTGLLVRLDRLGIIELLRDNRARALTARNSRWRSDNPMELHFREALLGDYFSTPFTGGCEALLPSAAVSGK